MSYAPDPIVIRHAPATTETLVEWLLTPETTIGMNLRREIADRLKELEERKPQFFDIGALPELIR